MVKVSTSDIVAILRRFDYATDEHMPRMIEHVKYSHPSPKNTLVSFRFSRQSFYLLFDDTAEDDTNYIISQMQADRPELVGTVVENPNDHLTTYALPFKGKEVYLIEVVPLKKRLDLTLAEKYPDISRSTWQKHIKAGHVSVNDKVQTSPKYDVADADSIAIDIPKETDFSGMELPVIYMDDNVVVINKPVGVLTHSKGALNDEFTVADFMRRFTTVGLETNRPGIVHRLDRDTSGVLIGARNQQTATLLQKQFADRKTKKTYLAVVDGVLKAPAAKIDLPIGRNPSAPSTFRVDPKGKNATTNYAVLSASATHSLVELRPITGRTHQLRVHMQYLHVPIHGDRVYGKPADRLYLHAAKLEITIPSGDRRVFEAPVPPEFKQLVEQA